MAATRVRNVVEAARPPPAQPVSALDAQRESWYAEAGAGYNSRDQMAQDQFNKSVAFLTTFITAAGALVLWVKADAGRDQRIGGWTTALILLLVLGAGFLSHAAMHLDLCANVSCKKALREYMLRLEEAPAAVAEGPWHALAKRRKFWEERFGRGKDPAPPLLTAKGSRFVRFSRWLMAGWPIALVALQAALLTL